MSSNKKCTSIGGQALIEGIMMKGPYKTVMAVRNTSGEIIKEEQSAKGLKDKSKIFKLPVIRGAITFIDALISGYKALMRSADLSGFTELDEAEERKEKAEKKAKKAKKQGLKSGKTEAEAESIYTEVFEYENRVKTEEEKAADKSKMDALMNVVMVVASVLGVALAVVLFMYLPAKLFNLLNGAVNESITGLRALFEGILKITIFFVYMFLVSLTPDIKRTFMYHGAEHKTIFCYEKGLPLTVENIKLQSRFHPRCGTSFMIVMLVVGILFTFLIQTLFPVVTKVIVVWVIVKILMLPIICGLGYEFLRYCGTHNNAVTRLLAAPGLWTQRITTKEPDDKIIEVAIAAMEEVIPEDGSDCIK